MFDPKLFVGVDVGSSYVKLAVVNETGEVLLRTLHASVEEFGSLSQALRDRALHELRVKPSAVIATVATGYGRDCVLFADAVKTELACHARGAFDSGRGAMTVVDIGGQDNKVIRVTAEGAVEDFALNRKCAAGTGSFLEVLSRRLGVSMEELSSLAKHAKTRQTLSSFCTVFAETEVLERMKAGEPREELAMAAYRSIAKRVMEMTKLVPPIVMSGGVVQYHPGVKQALEELLEISVEVAPQPQFTGAVGAAHFARLRAGLPQPVLR